MKESISRDHRDSAAEPSAASSVAPRAAPAADAKRLWRATLLATRARLTACAPDAIAQLNQRLADWLEEQDAHSLAFYWPTHGEPDLRETIVAWLARDTRRRAALPVIESARAPLVFRGWTPDAPMRPGRYGIPVPAAGEIGMPALLLIPCVGFDARGYRLGYGGGFYDRTLAAATPRPRTLGVALDGCRVAALPNEAHDLPLDHVLTETGAIDTAAAR
ncbi:5-formyltetrahydrofolate cyclo-ligase [Robbsia sp. Bb-Pol-6]|uniref:5-formyltetrahydrofolate cyclo-ligase n=1 Tax=Robbsia betulipollinis TaxID=2981849 RepID=A0ABT3ZKA1_9BURK|nr:5-formyltetrahydrofolate cyclo-ligase [Robbsia betulipollinis]MCY0386941.1 5-formyltetrahydrofolate cyclo-ligase [Robbsia betulipollinis]